MAVKSETRIPELVLGSLLTSAIFAMGMLFAYLQPATSTKEYWWNDATADFTLGLVLVGVAQAILFYFQWRLIRQTLRPTQDAANAAKLNAEAVINAERAHLIPSEIVVSGLLTAQNENNEVSLAVSYKFQNYGKTPAFIQRHGLMLFVCETLPATPPAFVQVYDTQCGPTAPNHWFGGNEPTVFPTPAGAVGTVIEGSCSLFAIGLIEYLDVFKQPHKSRFLYKMIFGTDGRSKYFAPAGTDAYWEYT